MKYNGVEVFGIMASLNAANSTKGQGRQFIRTNKKRFEKAYTEIIGWSGDFEDEFDELEVQRSQSGDVVGFTFNFEKGTDGVKAFNEYLRGAEFDVEPYLMTEEVMAFVDGVDLNQEQALMSLTLEFAKAKAEAEAEAEEE